MGTTASRAGSSRRERTISTKKKTNGSRPLGRPKGSRGVDTRRTILEVARECFQTLGFEETSLTVVAERAGLTRSAIYNYFDSKDVLARAVLLEMSGGNMPALIGRPWWRDEIPAELHAMDRLKHLLDVAAAEAVAQHHEADFYVRTVQQAREDPELRRTVAAYVRDQKAVVRRVIEDGITDGQLPADMDVARYVDAVQGTIWAVTIGIMVAPNEATRRQVRLGLDLLFHPAPPALRN